MNQEKYFGAIRLLNRTIDFVFSNPLPREAHSEPVSDIVFQGRTEAETKRALLRYWSENEGRLGMQLHEFKRRCSWQGEDNTIVFHRREN